jgi:hypothetical protein
MSISSADAGLGFFLSGQGFYGSAIAAVAIGLYLFTLKSCFGTFSLRKANDIYKKSSLIKKKYESLFATRDNLMYHISWSKSQGETEDAKRLMRQLAEVDKVRKVQIEHGGLQFYDQLILLNRKLTELKLKIRHCLEELIEQMFHLVHSLSVFDCKYF